jgi:epsilon-lactone hydrolase
VLFAQRAREAGIATQLEVWPILPHAFPLFVKWMPEARAALDDIVAFIRRHCGGQ